MTEKKKKPKGKPPTGAKSKDPKKPKIEPPPGKEETKTSKEEGHYCIYCGYFVKAGEYHHH